MTFMFMGRYLSRKAEDLLKKVYGKAPKVFYGSFIVFAAAVTLFWASIFFYISFYVAYLPEQGRQWPLHFKYEACPDSPQLCSNPVATVELEDHVIGSLFARGQKYKVFVDFKLPDSPTNHELGMFTTKLIFYGQDHCDFQSVNQNCPVQKSTRSSILKYRSRLVRIISTIVFSPLYLMGMMDESQILSLQMFSEVMEDPQNPFVRASVEVDSKYIQIYKGTLRYEADFSGIRYLMFYYPIVTAVVGILSVLNFLVISVFLSWYELITRGSSNSQHPAISQRVHGSSPLVPELEETDRNEKVQSQVSETESVSDQDDVKCKIRIEELVSTDKAQQKDKETHVDDETGSNSSSGCDSPTVSETASSFEYIPTAESTTNVPQEPLKHPDGQGGSKLEVLPQTTPVT